MFAALSSIFLMYLFYSVTDKHVKEVVKQQAAIALKFELAIRDYIAKNVRPLMYDPIGEDEFIPQVMSTSYVAYKVFDDVLKEIPHYILKISSDNPRNPAN